MRHLLTRNRVVLVVVAPFADAHFLAHEIHAVGGAVCYRKTLAILMNRNGSLMSVLNGPDDIFRPKGSITAEEYPGTRRLERDLIHHRRIPFAELDADIALNPGKCILLTDCENHVIRREKNLVHGA